MSNDNFLVSVIIPTYNRPDYLKKAIQTVLNQTYDNLEIIIVDDASTTDTMNVINSFNDERIIYIRNDKQSGAPVSRNNGIKKANGTCIAFLDDDDEWEPTKLEKQLKEFDDDNVGLVVCYSLDKRFGMTRISKPKRKVSFADLLKSFNLSSTSSYVARKIAVEKAGYFDVTLPSAQEYDLAIRLSKHYEVRTVPEVLMIQNASTGQISTNWKRKIRGILALYSKYGNEYYKLGTKMCIMNHLKVAGLVGLFFGGFFLGNKIYKIIIPFKEMYENV
jgi:glycosyltransferase involved in cell wall biosynthesis